MGYIPAPLKIFRYKRHHHQKRRYNAFAPSSAQEVPRTDSVTAAPDLHMHHYGRRRKRNHSGRRGKGQIWMTMSCAAQERVWSNKCLLKVIWGRTWERCAVLSKEGCIYIWNLVLLTSMSWSLHFISIYLIIWNVNAQSTDFRQMDHILLIRNNECYR